MSRSAGILSILVASIFFTAMASATKIAVPRSSTWDVIFWRSVIVAAVGAVLMRIQGVALVPGRPGLMLVRCVTGYGGMACFFWALGQIPIATATALIYTSPIWTVLLSGRIAGETRSPGVLPLTLVAFAGGVAIVAPGHFDVEAGSLAALAAGLLAGLAYLAVRNLRHADAPARIVFWFAAFSTLASAPLISEHALLPPPDLLGWFALVGLSAAGGQIFVTVAYRLERASIVSPFSYATLLFSYVAGVVFFDETLTPLASAGVAAILIAGTGLSALAARRNS